LRDLGEACAELIELLAVFGLADRAQVRGGAGLARTDVLVVDQDIEPKVGRSGIPSPRQPGNPAVMNAMMETHAMVRRLEASLRLAVAGHPGAARGGSDANTLAAIKAIENLGHALDRRDAALAAKIIDRLAKTIGQLPAVDEFPKWERIRPGPGGLPPQCPNCETFSLRVAVQSGAVLCILPGCKDLDGREPPQGRLDISRLNGEPVLVWRDGTVQYAPAA
jgi:hypothetical protein